MKFLLFFVIFTVYGQPETREEYIDRVVKEYTNPQWENKMSEWQAKAIASEEWEVLQIPEENRKKGSLVPKAEDIPNEGEALQSDKYVFFVGSAFSQWYITDKEHPGILFRDDQGNEYTSAEQFMMVKKAELFEEEAKKKADLIDEIKVFQSISMQPERLRLMNAISTDERNIQNKNKEIKEKMLKTADQKAIQDLGRQVQGFDQNVWDENKVKIVTKGNEYKFGQNENLKKKLLSFPKEKLFVEAAWYDKVWGIGLFCNTKSYLRNYLDVTLLDDEARWNGQNLLGKVLTEVRNKLQQETEKNMKRVFSGEISEKLTPKAQKMATKSQSSSDQSYP